MISVWHYLAVAAGLFGLGLVGFLTRRNVITAFLSAEMMLQAVVLNLLAFSRLHGNLNGQAFALIVVTVAACEAGLAMALFIALYRRTKSLDVSVWQGLRESGISPADDGEPLVQTVHEPDPTLAPAGAKPQEPARV